MAEPTSSGVIDPDLDLVQRVLDHLEIFYQLDEHGRLVTHWRGYSLFLRFHGDDDEVYSVRTLFDRLFTIDDKPAMRAVLDEWNRDTTWLKAYTATDDDGAVILVAEGMMRVDGGVTWPQFVATTAGWLHAARSFHQWLAQRLPFAGLSDDPS